MIPNSTPPPAVLLRRITDTGIIDPEAHDWLVSALVRWQDGLDWARASGLPSPDKVHKANRDYWLTFAARQFSGTNWQVASALHREALRFESRQWPLWRRGNIPPPTATDLEVALFFALSAGAPLPRTVQAYLAILKKHLRILTE